MSRLVPHVPEALSSSVVGPRWRRSAFAGDAADLARRLLGHLLVRRLPDGTLLAGRIVEAEAYMGEVDAASHAFRGRRTARNEHMYSRPGTAYVYFTYGMHHCMNVVCGGVNVPHAVLLRALEPLLGLDAMRALRAPHPGRRKRPARSVPDRDLCSGPARLCQALGISREQNGLDLVNGKTLFIAAPARRAALPTVQPRQIVSTPRIGIDYAGDWTRKPLRFVVAGSAHTSRRLAASGKRSKIAMENSPSPRRRIPSDARVASSSASRGRRSRVRLPVQE